jgi:hypothetical protein
MDKHTCAEIYGLEMNIRGRIVDIAREQDARPRQMFVLRALLNDFGTHFAVLFDHEMVWLDIRSSCLSVKTSLPM